MKSKKNSCFRTRSQVPEISLTPLIDTVLVLLIVFMMTAPAMYKTLNLELPTSMSDDQKPDSVEPVTVSIDKNHKLYVNCHGVDKDGFLNYLEKQFTGNQKRAVLIEVDKSVPWGSVVGIIDDIKYLAGVEYVGLPTYDV